MVSIKDLLYFAVYLDDVSMVSHLLRSQLLILPYVQQYNYALNAFKVDYCAGIYGNYEPQTGQPSETDRGQGHAVTGLGWAAEATRTVQSQGGDLYSLSNNLLPKAGEYSAKYNLNGSVPYDPKFYRCEATLINCPWAAPSAISRGIGTIAVWDVSYALTLLIIPRD